jgi:hypothetical protein
MSDTTTFCCLVEGDDTVFAITAPLTTPISVLKNWIKDEGKNGVLSSVDAKDLTLWKVRMTMASDSTTDSPVILSDITGDTSLAYGGYPCQAI